jgi:hypothetical protein
MSEIASTLESDNAFRIAVIPPPGHYLFLVWLQGSQ